MELSKTKRNTLARKKRKLEAKAAHAARVREAIESGTVRQDLEQRGFSSRCGGKEARARAARRSGGANGSDGAAGGKHHRAAGGAPRAVLPEHRALVAYLEGVEAGARRVRHPALIQRAPVPMDNHGTLDLPLTATAAAAAARAERDPAWCSLRSRGLRGMLSLQPMPTPLSALTTLDLSRNELWELPPLDALSGLVALDISRNWFTELPESLGALRALARFDASYNMLRSSRAALRLDALSAASAGGGGALRFVDLRFNSRLGKKRVADSVRAALGEGVELAISTNWDPSTGSASERRASMRGAAGGVAAAFVGASAAARDATTLRAQLEPWGTTALRRRLVADFGEAATDPAFVSRADVMQRLLSAYAADAAAARGGAAAAKPPPPPPSAAKRIRSGSGGERSNGAGRAAGGGVARAGGAALTPGRDGRVLVHCDGVEVSAAAREALLCELRCWADAKASAGAQRERPSIRAQSYMILTAPSALLAVGSLKATKGLAKLEAHRALWKLARNALEEVDPEFAAQYSALAVTHNFEGSPHMCVLRRLRIATRAAGGRFAVYNARTAPRTCSR